MANSLTHTLPYPIRNARFTLPLTFRVAAGTLTDPTTPDTEFSTDGGATFGDCAEEITTGGSNGLGYLTLSGSETNNNVVLIAAKSANCLTTPAILFPRILPVLSSGTASAGGATSITLGTILAYDITGCIVKTTGGTGGGGSGGANNQARVITAYNTGTGECTVSPAWETNPDGTTTYEVLLTDLAANSPITRGLRPTTDGRTLDVTATGAAGIDWSNVENKTSTVDLTNTTISTGQVVASVTGAVGSVTGNVGGNVTGSVGSVTGNIGGNVNGNVNGNVVGSTGSVTGSVGSVTGSVGSVAGNVAGDVQGKVIGGGASTITGDGVQASSVTGSVGSVSGSVGSVTGSVGSVTGNVGGDVAGKVLGGGSGVITGDGVRASSVTGNVGGNVTGNVGGNVTGSVGSVVADVNVSGSDIRTDLGLASANLDTQLGNIRKIQLADYYIDTTTTPWELVFVEQGGGTTGTDIVELFRKKLYDVNGAAITNTTTVIGQAIDE